MAFTNNVMIVRHRLLENLVALWKENELIKTLPNESKTAPFSCLE